MKKIVLTMVMCTSVLFANAQLLLEENFNYPLGNLEGNGAVKENAGAWYKCNKSGDDQGTSPQIISGSLSYPDYSGQSLATVAKLDPANGPDGSPATARISTKYIINAAGDTAKYSGVKTVYAAFLVKVSSEGSKLNADRDIITFEGSLTSSMTRGRIFARINSSNQVIFSIGKNATPTTKFDPVACGQSHLLVMVYNVVDGDSNDVIDLYLNPDPTKSESEQAASVKLSSADVQPDYGVNAGIAINLRQRNINALIGGIRVGSSWADIMGESSGQNPNPGTYISKEIIHEQFNTLPWADQTTYGNGNFTINVGTSTGIINLENSIINTTTNPSGVEASSPGRIQLQKTDSQTNPGILELPEVSSCGSIRVNANAGNISRTFKLQKYLDNGTWIDLTTFTTSPEYADGTGVSSSCKALNFSYDVNSVTPVKLRLINNTSSSLYIYELWVTDYVEETSPNSIKTITGDKGTAIAKRYYTLTGVRIQEPASGIFIQQSVYENGVVETVKILK